MLACGGGGVRQGHMTRERRKTREGNPENHVERTCPSGPLRPAYWSTFRAARARLPRVVCVYLFCTCTRGLGKFGGLRGSQSLGNSASGHLCQYDVPPDVSQSPSPRLLDHIVATCIAKEPDERWQSIADVKRELRWIADTVLPARVPMLPARSRLFERRRWMVATLVLLFGLVGILTVTIRHLRESSLPPGVVRFAVSAPAGTTFAAVNASVPSTQLALPPDGRHLAFVASAAW